MSVGIQAHYDKERGVYTLDVEWKDGERPKDIAEAADWTYALLGWDALPRVAEVKEVVLDLTKERVPWFHRHIWVWQPQKRHLVIKYRYGEETVADNGEEPWICARCGKRHSDSWGDY